MQIIGKNVILFILSFNFIYKFGYNLPLISIKISLNLWLSVISWKASSTLSKEKTDKFLFAFNSLKYELFSELL